jgi:L-lysine 6-transaminase
VRCRRILEVIEADDLFTNAQVRGAELLAGLQSLAADHEIVTNPRGLGLMCAVTMPDQDVRDRVLKVMLESERVIMLGCGERSLRLRPALTVTADVVQLALDALGRALTAVEHDLDRSGHVQYA